MDKGMERELKKLHEKEYAFLQRESNAWVKSRIDPWKEKVEEKIPIRLTETLQKVFARSFRLIFEKGDTWIERTYKKDQKILEHELLDDGFDDAHRQSVKGMDHQAKTSKRVNTAVSVLEGGVLGFLGIGLPDIPVFLAVIIRHVYEIGLSYGYDYERDSEKAYVLLVISGALAEGAENQSLSDRADLLGSRIDRRLVNDLDLPSLMDETAAILAEAMLVAKFIQGLPVVGVVGGLTNYTMIRRIGKYAGLKYKKRYLMRKLRTEAGERE